MSTEPALMPLNQARQRIHVAAMTLFAERGVTKVNISELAAATGMARGTIYSHVPDVDGLFQAVAARLAQEMTARVSAGMVAITDPAQRLSIGVRQYIRRAHDEPLWGRFMSRFGLSPALTQELLASDPAVDLQAGIASGRYRISGEQLPAMVGLLVGGTLAAMLPVLDGRSTWRDAGADTAELLLVALGVSRDEARALATAELPPLPALPPAV
jgi:AcrR family transcriptional regulator